MEPSGKESGATTGGAKPEKTGGMTDAMREKIGAKIGAMTGKRVVGVGAEAASAIKGANKMADEDHRRDPVQEALRLAAEVVHEQQETIEHLIRCLCRKCHCRCHEDDDDDRGDRDRRRGDRDRDER